MKNIEVLDCFQPSQVMLERVNYFPRQLLTVEDMVTERDYFLQKLRRHNRFLHGWGVVCGLEVSPAPDKGPWVVQIASGYALGPYGDEIYVAEPVLLDLSKCEAGTTTNPCEPDLLSPAPARNSIGAEVFIAIKYAECFARPVRAMPAGCACEDEACEYSRIRDSFEMGCLGELPPQPEIPNLCDLIANRQPTPCPPCPTTPWVMLARVTLPTHMKDNLSASQIDNVTIRRQLYSTAILQQGLIDCCCHDRPRPDPPKVTGVNYTPNKVYRIGPGGEQPPREVVITFSKSLNPLSPNSVQLDARAKNFDWLQLGFSTPPVYDETSKTVRFVPDPLFTGRPPGFPTDAQAFDYRVTVRGTGTAQITDTDGTALDGANTGSPGSDYTSMFFVEFNDNPD